MPRAGKTWTCLKTVPNINKGENNVNKTKLINDLRKAYVDVLAKHRKLYHFDDSAKDIIHHKTGEPLFTKEEEEILDQITNALYSPELFDIANKYLENED